MRIVGDPKLPIRKVAANWGYAGGFRGFTRSDIDALIVGESREWRAARLGIVDGHRHPRVSDPTRAVWRAAAA